MPLETQDRMPGTQPSLVDDIEAELQILAHEIGDAKFKQEEAYNKAEARINRLWRQEELLRRAKEKILGN